MTKITLASLLLVFCVALASGESSRHGKAVKVTGKSGKAASHKPSKNTPVVHVAGSKSGKSEDTTNGSVEAKNAFELEVSSKSSKAAFVDEVSMSMSVSNDELVSQHRTSGKAEKGGDYITASAGKSEKQTVGAKSGNKPLTNFFIKSATNDSSKAGKSTEIKTVHTETTTVTYMNAGDLEMIKPKSSKSVPRGGSKASRPSVIDLSASSAKANKAQIEGSSSSKSNKSTSTSSTVSADNTSSTTASLETTTVSSATESPSTTTQTAETTSIIVASTEALDNGETEDDTLLTLAPTPPAGSKENRYSQPSYMPTTHTYHPSAFDEPSSFELSTAGETAVAINPFALNLQADPSNIDIESVRIVTMEHLVHSFRNNPSQYVVNRLKLMLLDPEGERRLAYADYLLYFGGILYFANDDVPSMEEIDSVVKASFKDERLNYYMNLLLEAGVDVNLATLEEVAEPHSRGSEKWKAASIGLASALGSLALVATGFRVFHKRRLELGDDDIEGGRFIIKLKDDAEVEEFPGINSCPSTVAYTDNDTSTVDDRSVPSAVGDVPSLGSRSLDDIEQETFDPRISPLEEPEAETRYISVFTVKKDVKGKRLEDVDLRALTVAYLSKLMKKHPTTIVLPHNESSTSRGLSPITSIRNIPHEMGDLERYIGNARIDENSGKVMFNLRVESDMPVSQMKSKKKNTGNTLSRSLVENKTKENEENDVLEDVAI